MIKIAVACDNETVSEHFGYCSNFRIFEVENNKIIKRKSIPNPGHKPGFLPNFLNEIGINVIISGGMGGGAIDIFNTKRIEVITGASGNSNDVVERYINGTLKTTGYICHDHQHHS